MKKFIKPFLLGIIAALGALFLELILYLIFPEQETQQDYYNKITVFLFFVVAIEELLKVLMIYKNSRELSGENDIFISSFLVGVGFVLTELFLKDSTGQSFFSSGNLNIILVHLLTAGLVGYFISQRPNPQKKFLIKIWLLAFFVHLLYNLLIIYIF